MPPRAITQLCPQCGMPLLLPITFVGRSVACTRCGQMVQVSAPPEAGVADLLPPGAAGVPGAALPLAVAEPVVTLPIVEPVRRAPKRSCLYSGCVTLIVAVMVVSTVVGVGVSAALLVRWDSRASLTGEQPETEGGFSKRQYSDASRKAITIGGVSVRVDKVQVGRLDYRSKGKILQTDLPHYLMVNLNVKNKSRSEPVNYRSWYDHQFENDAGQRQDVELRDDNGTLWEVFLVPGAEQVERHIRSDAELQVDDEVTDTLVFKLPEERVDEPIPPLYLRLPGAAVGSGDDYRFHVPAVMIDRRD